MKQKTRRVVVREVPRLARLERNGRPLPLLGMLEFTTQGRGGEGRTLDTWRTLADVSTVSLEYPALREGFLASVGLGVVTPLVMLALLVPTMTWVRLRLPGPPDPNEAHVSLTPAQGPQVARAVGVEAPPMGVRWVAFDEKPRHFNSRRPPPVRVR